MNAQHPRSEAEIATRIDTRLRRAEVRSIVMAALRDAAPLTTAQLRERVGAQMGGSRRCVSGDVGAALRSLRYRQLAHNDGEGWAPGSPDVSKRRHPLAIRGPCKRCGELHLSGARCPPKP